MGSRISGAIVIGVLTVAFSTCSGLGATATFIFNMDGAQAAAGAGTGSAATGFGTVTLDTTSNLLTWIIAFDAQNLINGAGSVTAAHFHSGPRGVSGAALTPPGNIVGAGTSPLAGSATVTDADKAKLLAGSVYFNIHTTAFTAGEIRGQVVPSSIAIGAAKDNTLYESISGSLSNGAGQYFFCGKGNNGYIKRGLIMFDIAGSGIPAGSRIKSAKLELNMSKTIVGPQAVSLHRVLKGWGEGSSNANAQEGSGALATSGDATWLHTFFSSSFWDNPGGDFSAAASASRSVGGTGLYAWESAGATADVQSWLDEPAGNFGWLVKGNESSAPTAKRFDSRESPANRPKLTVEYEGPCLFRTAGDINDDCVVDFLDFAVTASNWLVDCTSIPVDPACVPAY